MTRGARSSGVGYALVALAAIGWGTWPFLLKRISVPVTLQSAVLMTALALFSVPFMLVDRVRVRASRRQWLAVAWLGVADALNVLLFFAAYGKTSVAIAVLTHYLTPIFVALAAPFLLGERAQARTALAVATAFFGLTLVLEPWGKTVSPHDLVGAALGAGSAVFYASNVIVNKRLSKAFSASELMCFHGLVALPILWALVPSGAVAEAPRASLVILLLGALGPGVLGGLMFVWGLRRIDASHASILTLLEPLVAVVGAALLYGQVLGPLQLLGGLCILAGALMVVVRARA